MECETKSSEVKTIADAMFPVSLVLTTMHFSQQHNVSSGIFTWRFVVLVHELRYMVQELRYHPKIIFCLCRKFFSRWDKLSLNFFENDELRSWVFEPRGGNNRVVSGATNFCSNNVGFKTTCFSGLHVDFDSFCLLLEVVQGTISI